MAMRLRSFLRNNGLTVALFGIFFLSIVGMSVTGWSANNESLSDHNGRPLSYVAYLGSGNFIEGVFENWESEFLQMWALVVLTVWLRQKGSSDSKPLRGKASQETQPRYPLSSAHSFREVFHSLGEVLYSHSLSIALFLFFTLAFILHAIGGTADYNIEALQHGSEQISTWEFMGTSDFWYQSLQNWQSEFLAVGMLTILTIKLRERGSPQSKPVGKKYNHETG